MKNVSEVERVMKEIMLKEVEPYLPFEFTHEGMLERVSALVQNQVRDRFLLLFLFGLLPTCSSERDQESKDLPWYINLTHLIDQNIRQIVHQKQHGGFSKPRGRNTTLAHAFDVMGHRLVPSPSRQCVQLVKQSEVANCAIAVAERKRGRFGSSRLDLNFSCFSLLRFYYVVCSRALCN